MTRWARLTWQAGEPASLVADLERRLGVPGEAAPGGAWWIRLGDEALEVVPWLSEGPRDLPAAGGRLVLEPIEVGAQEAAPAPAVDAPLSLAGVVWATVELDRAEAELHPWLEPSDPELGDGDAHADPHLGAHARLRRTSALPGGTLILAEPSTEGRLAASLARDGEGPCALVVRPSAGLDTWLAAARERGVQVSARRRGPLGPAVLLPGPTVAGPHVLVVDVPAPARRASTIAP